jgi:hypothetical protein
VLNDFLMEPIETEDVSIVELRSNPVSVEDLVRRIADLVYERQTLRAHAANTALLERNRVALVRANQELSFALIDRHCPPKADAAVVAA